MLQRPPPLLSSFVRRRQCQSEECTTLTGHIARQCVKRQETAVHAYNLEVHGEHVYRVTADGVLVHNACIPAIARHGEAAMKGRFIRQDMVAGIKLLWEAYQGRGVC